MTRCVPTRTRPFITIDRVRRRVSIQRPYSLQIRNRNLRRSLSQYPEHTTYCLHQYHGEQFSDPREVRFPSRLRGYGYWLVWANNLALGAVVVLLNPPAKGRVYVTSFVVGTLLLRSGQGITHADVRLAEGLDMLVRLSSEMQSSESSSPSSATSSPTRPFTQSAVGAKRDGNRGIHRVC